jgi:hypothetical protein
MDKQSPETMMLRRTQARIRGHDGEASYARKRAAGMGRAGTRNRRLPT